MSVADDFVFSSSHFAPGPARKSPSGGEHAAREAGAERAPLHRIARVRNRLGVSVRSAARRMGVPMEQVRREERPDADLPLSALVRWQMALEVPLAELLVDDNAPVSAPILKRARWLRLMKTVKALAEASPTAAVSRMTEMLEQQLVELMPELSDVTAWHSVGQRRTQDELGRIAQDVVPTSFARDGLR